MWQIVYGSNRPKIYAGRPIMVGCFLVVGTETYRDPNICVTCHSALNIPTPHVPTPISLFYCCCCRFYSAFFHRFANECAKKKWHEWWKVKAREKTVEQKLEALVQRVRKSSNQNNFFSSDDWHSLSLSLERTFAEYGIDKICFFNFFFFFIALAFILFSELRACRVRPFHFLARVCAAAVFTFQPQSSITMEDNSLPFQALTFALALLCYPLHFTISLAESWLSFFLDVFFIFLFILAMTQFSHLAFSFTV